MASAYSTSICRSSTALPRNSNEFRVRRATMFGNGLYVGTISGNPSRPVRKHAMMKLSDPHEYARLLYRAFRHRFFRETTYDDRSRGIFVEMNPPSETIRVIEPDMIITVTNGCCTQAVLDALNNLCGECGKPPQCNPCQTAAIRNWWLTGSVSTKPVDPLFQSWSDASLSEFDSKSETDSLSVAK